MIEFRSWPKTPRLLRDIIITEKIDGSNAAIGIVPLSEVDRTWEGRIDEPEPTDVRVLDLNVFATAERNGESYGVYAQSRKRLITPGKANDNFGFAGWVESNADELVAALGPGLHFGEWWGNGIQRGYGQTERRFSLFNTHRHKDLADHPLLDVVPVLYHGPNDTDKVASTLADLKEHGSCAAPGFMNPEGICVYHVAARETYKVTLDNQDAGKWESSDPATVESKR